VSVKPAAAHSAGCGLDDWTAKIMISWTTQTHGSVLVFDGIVGRDR
jgi:hypothetical protein